MKPGEEGVEFDVATVLAIGMLAYAIRNVVHEGLGHGVACLLVGGRPLGISSAWWDGSYEGVSTWAHRGVRAAGTVANLALGAALVPTWRWLERGARATPHARFFVWLLLVVNLFSGAGYLLADPLGHFGDWTGFLEGLEPNLPVRVGLVTLGAVLSALTLRFALRTVDAFLAADGAERRRRLRWLCWGPYLVGGTIFVLAGLQNPHGPVFAFTSGLSTFGGTAFLAWLPAWVKAPRSEGRGASGALARSPGWIAAGVASGLVVLVVLARGISFVPSADRHEVTQAGTRAQGANLAARVSHAGGPRSDQPRATTRRSASTQAERRAARGAAWR